MVRSRRPLQVGGQGLSAHTASPALPWSQLVLSQRMPACCSEHSPAQREGWASSARWLSSRSPQLASHSGEADGQEEHSGGAPRHQMLDREVASPDTQCGGRSCFVRGTGGREPSGRLCTPGTLLSSFPLQEHLPPPEQAHATEKNTPLDLHSWFFSVGPPFH